MSKETGISVSSLSAYEKQENDKGYRKPKIENWIKLADFFDVPVAYLQGSSNLQNPSFEDYIKKHRNEFIHFGDYENAFHVYTEDEVLKRYFKFSNLFLDKKQKALVDMQNSIQDKNEFAQFDYYLSELLDMFLNAATNHDQGSVECYKKLDDLISKYREVDHSIFKNNWFMKCYWSTIANFLIDRL